MSKGAKGYLLYSFDGGKLVPTDIPNFVADIATKPPEKLEPLLKARKPKSKAKSKAKSKSKAIVKTKAKAKMKKKAKAKPRAQPTSSACLSQAEEDGEEEEQDEDEVVEDDFPLTQEYPELAHPEQAAPGLLAPMPQANESWIRDAGEQQMPQVDPASLKLVLATKQSYITGVLSNAPNKKTLIVAISATI